MSSGETLWRRKAPACLLAAMALFLLAGCRDDMQNQPYERPLRIQRLLSR